MPGLVVSGAASLEGGGGGGAVRRAPVTRPLVAGALVGGVAVVLACGSGLDGGREGRALAGLVGGGKTSSFEKLRGLSAELNPGRGAAGRLAGGGVLGLVVAEGGLAATF
jgi:hypothetical protein